jgi:hypothetical protein
MSLPKEYNRALHRQAGFYAAWFPVTTPLRIGNYGLIENGVFRAIGHLDDLRGEGFDVEIRTAEGPPASLDLLSQGARTVRTIAGGTVEVPQLPDTDVEARITYEFERENAFVVKAATLRQEQMENIDQVARKLAELRRRKRWSHRFRVVSATHTGESCLVLLSSERGTKVEFEASARVLKQLDLGNVEVRPGLAASSETVLQSVGATGVLGLGLFKLRLLGSGLKLLEGRERETAEAEIVVDTEDDLEDDL